MVKCTTVCMQRLSSMHTPSCTLNGCIREWDASALTRTHPHQLILVNICDPLLCNLVIGIVFSSLWLTLLSTVEVGRGSDSTCGRRGRECCHVCRCTKMVAGSYSTSRRRSERGCAVRLNRRAVSISNGRHVEHDSVEAGESASEEMSSLKEVSGNSEM
jgi:hypothetical protein